MEYFKHLNIWYKRAIAGTLGAAAGFAYYYYIGCATGTCPITSNPYISTFYGAVIGILTPSKTKATNGNNNTASTGKEI
ncbi:MAG: hypothetical protein H3C35_11870 [Bacteroidetes bacterium]|nr:hypothetical protein [Bacteroidota bacterium]